MNCRQCNLVGMWVRRSSTYPPSRRVCERERVGETPVMFVLSTPPLLLDGWVVSQVYGRASEGQYDEEPLSFCGDLRS